MSVDLNQSAVRFSEQEVLNRAFDPATGTLAVVQVWRDPIDGLPYADNTRIQGGLAIYKFKTDVSGNYTYIGSAVKGTLATQPNWYINKLTYSAGYITDISYATGAWTNISGLVF